jgi:hypothetical protein
VVLQRRVNTIWLVTVVLFSAVTVSAQQPTCSLKLDQLPLASELRGFRLGMTYDQVKTRVPQVQFGRVDQFGIVKTSINPLFDPRFDKASFEDVRTISLDFLDGQLVSLWIGYQNTFKWQTLDEFVAGISNSLNLPMRWSAKRGGRQLTCDGFSVFTSLIAGSPSVRISNETAQETLASRREEAARAAEVADSIVIGDTKTRLYYPSDCHTQQTVPETSRVTFKDKDEAAKAGYKLARDCQ